MKNVVGFIALSSAFVFHVHAKPLVVYGEDNRQEVYEASSAHQLLAKSTATMISKNEMTISASAPDLVQFNQRTLQEWLGDVSGSSKSKSLFSPAVLKVGAAGNRFCGGTRFVNQPNAGMCSGFLIAPDLIVTAGHCVELENFCEDYRWVFEYQLDKETQTAGVDVNPANIYSCKKVISNALVTSLGLDFAVVQLERKVSGREPLVINNTGTISDKQGLLVIGSPSGLPLKVAANANVRTNTHPNYFSANLDTFQGNSGSAVFNSDTGVVEGILVRGETDFVANRFMMCVEVNVCKNNECRGEDVSRLTSIPEIGIQKALNQAAVSGDLNLLNRVLELNTWVDFYTKDGQSALIKAAAVAQSSSVNALISKGADVNLQDVKGNTSIHELVKVLTPESKEVLVSLLGAGANTEIRNDMSETAIIVAAKNLNLYAANMLVEANADKNAVDINNENIIFPFARAGNLDAVVELARAGVEVKSSALEFRDVGGDTLLLAAVKKSNISAVVGLISFGADINALDSKGENALYAALSANSLEIVRALVDGGIKVEVENKDGISPLQLARKLKLKEAKKILRKERREQRKAARI